MKGLLGIRMSYGSLFGHMSEVLYCSFLSKLILVHSANGGKS